MKKLMLLGLMVLLVFACTIGCGKNGTKDEVKITDERVVINYLNDKIGEDNYDSLIIDETNGYDYLIAYRAYENGNLIDCGAINREQFTELYYGTID